MRGKIIINCSYKVKCDIIAMCVIRNMDIRT